MVPTLYVWGTNDATVGKYAADLTKDYVHGQYRFVAMEGAGHFLVDQFPSRITTILLSHLREHRT
jgi:pimeloyl-ACP methyl ester carboxylesterase